MPGSLAYVAPERFSGVEGDPRADVYALACVLHQALTGRPPFEGDLATLMRAHLAAPPPRPTSTRPELPAGLDRVVARGMAKDPADRPATAGDLAAAARTELGIRTDSEADPWRAATAPVATTSVVPPAWAAAAPQPGYGPRPHPAPTGYGPQQPAYAPTAVGGYGPPPAGWTSHPSHPSHPSQPVYPAPPASPGHPGGGPQRPGGRGPLIAIVVLVVLALAGGGITWGVLAGTGDAPPPGTTPRAASAPVAPTTPPPTPTPEPTPEPTADPEPAPDAETDRLLADLPAGYGPDLCVAEPVDGSAATASVYCGAEPSTGTGPSNGYFFRYADVSTMNTEFEQYAADTGAAETEVFEECGSGDPVRMVYDRQNSDLGGRLLCYTDDTGTAYLAWTDDAALGLGIVSDSAGDAEALFGWWRTNDFKAER
jgi:serine/threonine-protein kinase